MKKLTFGWMANANADGFEQEHGDFTIEVYWDDPLRIWNWMVWTTVGATQQCIDRGQQKTLGLAKKVVLHRVAELTAERMKHKKK